MSEKARVARVFGGFAYGGRYVGWRVHATALPGLRGRRHGEPAARRGGGGEPPR